MGAEQLFIIVITIIVGVIGYFLKGVIDEVRGNKSDISEMKTDLRVLESDTKNKQENILDKIETINEVIKDLMVEIKVISKILLQNQNDFKSNQNNPNYRDNRKE